MAPFSLADHYNHYDNSTTRYLPIWRKYSFHKPVNIKDLQENQNLAPVSMDYSKKRASNSFKLPAL